MLTELSGFGGWHAVVHKVPETVVKGELRLLSGRLYWRGYVLWPQEILRM